MNRRSQNSLPKNWHAFVIGDEFDAPVWDKQFERDAKSGKLDKLANKAVADFEFGALIKQARKQAKDAGLKPTDITSAVATARGKQLK